MAVRNAKKTTSKAGAGSSRSATARKGASVTSSAAKKTVAKTMVKATAKVASKKAVRRAPVVEGAAGLDPAASSAPDRTSEGYRLPSGDPVIRQLLQDLVKFLDDKKLTDLRVINLEEVNPYFCFFVIVTANSQPQLQSVARDVAKQFGQHLTNKKVRPLDFESGWVIQDFVDIVLHIFLKEQRDYYNLEKLWADAPTIYSSGEPRFRWPQQDTKKAE